MTPLRRLWYTLSRRKRLEGGVLLCGIARGALFEALSTRLVVPFITTLNDPGRMMANPAFRKLFALVNVQG